MKEIIKDTERQERLNQVYRHLFAHFNIDSQTKFADALHVQRTALSAAMNGNKAYLTNNLFTKICAAFPGVFNYEYLTKGVGSSVERSVNVPSTYIGTTGTLSISIFGFSSATEWTTDVTVTAKDGSSAVLGSATIENAPFKRNRATEYHGNLFAVASSMNLTLNDTWDDASTGTW